MALRELTPKEERERIVRHAFGSAYEVITSGEVPFLEMLKERIEELIEAKKKLKES